VQCDRKILFKEPYLLSVTKFKLLSQTEGKSINWRRLFTRYGKAKILDIKKVLKPQRNMLVIYWWSFLQKQQLWL